MEKGKGFEVTEKNPDGFYCSKMKLILIFAVALILIIVVGVVAGVVPRQMQGNNQGAQGTSSMATTKPTGSMQPGTSKAPPSVTTAATTKPKVTVAPSKYPAVNNIRLPKNVIPVQYWFDLDVDMVKSTFTGGNTIQINVTSSTDIIIVHANQMTITEVAVGDDKAISNPKLVKEKNAYAPNDYYYVVLTSPLSIGTYYIKFSFTANVSTALNGLYKSTYTRKNGEVVNIAASQCQPTDARKVIPMFDEPALKANFTATISTQAMYTSVLWNTPILETIQNKPRAGYTQRKYDTSVKMSSYLLAFVIADFANITGYTKGGTPLSIWATNDTIDQGHYSLVGGINMTEYYETFFGIPYPLKKQDMVAVPDFAAGAMENWGLILYRETALLYDPKVSAANNKQRVAYVVAHELAHMWFGNLVTMKWWDDLWLNEGFASFTEYLGTAEYEPTWEMMNQFVPLDVHRAFGLDAFVTSHPVQVTVSHPDKINEAFDAISYSKGASIIRMMRHMLGDGDFKTGISNYLKKYEFSNAVTADLWKTLTQYSTKNINVTEVMDTWTLQMGFPVVKVTTSGSAYAFTQQRFLLDPSQNPSVDPANSRYKSPYGYKWNIPLTYFLKNSLAEKTAMYNMKTSLTITETPTTGNWIKVNKDGYGFYRVNYDNANWQLLITEMQQPSTALSKTDLAGLIDDAFNLARVGQLSYDIAFGTTTYLKAERNYVPWRSAYTALNEIGAIIAYRASYGDFSAYYSRQLKPLLAYLDFKDEGSHTDKLLRMSVMSYACGLGNENCLKNASMMFKNFMEKNISVAPNLKAIVYRYGIQAGGVMEWDWLYHYYSKVAQVASEKRTILDALSYSREPWILNRYLRWAINSSKVRTQDSAIVIEFIANNVVGRPLAWDFVRENWKQLRKLFGGSFFSFSRLIRSTAGQFSSQFRLDQVQNFFKLNPDQGSGAGAVKQSIENIKNRISWIKNYEKIVVTWLKNANANNL